MVNTRVELATLALLAPRSKPTELIDLIYRGIRYRGAVCVVHDQWLPYDMSRTLRVKGPSHASSAPIHALAVFSWHRKIPAPGGGDLILSILLACSTPQLLSHTTSLQPLDGS